MHWGLLNQHEIILFKTNFILSLRRIPFKKSCFTHFTSLISLVRKISPNIKKNKQSRTPHSNQHTKLLWLTRCFHETNVELNFWHLLNLDLDLGAKFTHWLLSKQKQQLQLMFLARVSDLEVSCQTSNHIMQTLPVLNHKITPEKTMQTQTETEIQTQIER